MKLVWIGGNHPRHLYFANEIAKEIPLAGALVELREHMLPNPPEGIAEIDRKNFIHHFEQRDLAEAKHFGKQDFPDCPILKIEGSQLNSQASVDFIRTINPDVVLICGSGLIKNPLADALPLHTLNLHLGLSPRYRGAATLFWPFYFMEPRFAGTTFHYIVAEADAGDIVHQTVPELSKGDRIHDVACKALIASAKDARMLLRIFKTEKKWIRHPQKNTGRKFLSTEFKPEQLRVIYNLFNDDLVDRCLTGELGKARPKLVKQF